MTQGRTAPSRRAFWLLLLASALPYLVSLPFEFVYDDHGQLLENAYLGNPANLGEVLTLQTLREADVVNGRRPAVLVSYFVDRTLWGTQPWGYHLTNLLLHLAVVALLFSLVRRLATAPIALATALCFGVHPVLFEAAHVPSFRPDLLYMLFVLAALHIPLGLVEQYSWRWLVRVMAFGGLTFLALCAKESGVVVIPLVAGMWYLFPPVRPPRGTMQVLGGMAAAVVLLFALLCIGGAPLQAAGASWNGLAYQFPSNLATMPWLFTRYAGLMIWPHPLVVDHVLPPVTTWSDLRWVAGIVILAAAGWTLWRFRHRQPLSVFGGLLFLSVFATVANVVPLLNPFAERYAYGMTAGFALLVGAFIGNASPRTRQRLLGAVVFLALLLQGFHLPAWRNDQTLWAATLEQEPDSTRAMVWSALDRKRQGARDEAQALLERAMKTNPQDTFAIINLAVMTGEDGDLEKAEALLRESIERRPEHADAYANLALDLELQGRGDEATVVLEQGLRVDGHNMGIRRMLIDRLMEEEAYRRAREVAHGTLELDPDNEQAQRAIEFTAYQLGE